MTVQPAIVQHQECMRVTPQKTKLSIQICAAICVVSLLMSPLFLAALRLSPFTHNVIRQQRRTNATLQDKTVFYASTCRRRKGRRASLDLRAVNDTDSTALVTTREKLESLQAQILRTYAPRQKEFEQQLESKILANVCISGAHAGYPRILLIGDKEHISQLSRSLPFVDIDVTNPTSPGEVVLRKPMAYSAEVIERAPKTFTWVPGFSLHVMPMSNINHNLYDRVLPALTYAMCSKRHDAIYAGVRTDIRMFIQDSHIYKSYPRSAWCQWLPVMKTLEQHSVLALPESNAPVCFEKLLLSWRSEMRMITSLRSLPPIIALEAITLYRDSIRSMFLPSKQNTKTQKRVKVLIYARSDAKRKLLLNGEALAKYLRETYPHFNVIFLDKKRRHLPSVAPFSVQVQDYASADVIISPHGAWSAHAPTMKRGAVLIELCSDTSWFWRPVQRLVDGIEAPIRNCTTAGGEAVADLKLPKFYKNATVDMLMFQNIFKGIVELKDW
jgi:Glycosyltransferase 61